MYVAASTECFPHLSLEAALTKLSDLEYSRVEIGIREDGPHMKPSEVAANLDSAIRRSRDTHRLTPVSYFVDTCGTGSEAYERFAACAKLAKATKVVVVSVPASELGFPFNEEVARLRELVRIAGLEGVLVGVKTEAGRITQDPETTLSLCSHVKGLGVSLDPSHFVYGPAAGANYTQLLPHVLHVQLRDSSKDAFQVQVGQGEIDYGKIVTQLSRHKYNRALSVNMAYDPESEFDHDTEMRKLRLLLESLL